MYAGATRTEKASKPSQLDCSRFTLHWSDHHGYPFIGSGHSVLFGSHLRHSQAQDHRSSKGAIEKNEWKRLQGHHRRVSAGNFALIQPPWVFPHKYNCTRRYWISLGVLKADRCGLLRNDAVAVRMDSFSKMAFIAREGHLGADAKH